MISCYLTKIKTRDGITLEGIYVPPKRKGSIALVVVHGLSSRFSSGQTLIKELSSVVSKNNVGYFKFNNRGHDIVNRDGRGKKLQGAGFEKFEDCIFDIEAIIRFAKSLGYKKIILAGHSTGANKVLYYLYKTPDHIVKGLILASPISDISAEIQRRGLKTVLKNIKLAQKLKREKLMPNAAWVYTARRYLSLYKSGSAEDVFPYHNPNGNWKALKSIRIPTAVIIGSRDQYLDRSAKSLVEIFKKNAVNAKTFFGFVIPGANHSFIKKEKALSTQIIKWIKNYALA